MTYSDTIGCLWLGAAKTQHINHKCHIVVDSDVVLLVYKLKQTFCHKKIETTHPSYQNFVQLDYVT